MGLMNFKKQRNGVKPKKSTAVDGQKQQQQKKNTGNSSNAKSTNKASSQKIPSDVPVNISIQKKERRRNGLSRSAPNQQQQSTFSLVSNSMQRGISERLENPHLWEYDNDVYTKYDVNEEIKQEDTYTSEESFSHYSYSDGHNSYRDHYHNHEVSESALEEESFFAANPLPGLTPKNKHIPQRRASAPLMTSAPVVTVTDIPAGDPTFSTPEVTRNLIKQYIGEIWNQGKVELIPQVCSPGIRFNSMKGGFDKIGHEGLAQMVHNIHGTLDDYHCEVHCMVVEGNKAFCRLKFSGLHVGSLFGYPPTGKRLTWTGASEFTCVNGEILKVWELTDMCSVKEMLYENAMQEALAQDEEEEEHGGSGGYEYDYHRY